MPLPILGYQIHCISKSAKITFLELVLWIDGKAINICKPKNILIFKDVGSSCGRKKIENIIKVQKSVLLTFIINSSTASLLLEDLMVRARRFQFFRPHTGSFTLVTQGSDQGTRWACLIFLVLKSSSLASILRIAAIRITALYFSNIEVCTPVARDRVDPSYLSDKLPIGALDVILSISLVLMGFTMQNTVPRSNSCLG